MGHDDGAQQTGGVKARCKHRCRTMWCGKATRGGGWYNAQCDGVPHPQGNILESPKKQDPDPERESGAEDDGVDSAGRDGDITECWTCLSSLVTWVEEDILDCSVRLVGHHGIRIVDYEQRGPRHFKFLLLALTRHTLGRKRRILFQAFACDMSLSVGK